MTAYVYYIYPHIINMLAHYFWHTLCTTEESNVVRDDEMYIYLVMHMCICIHACVCVCVYDKSAYMYGTWLLKFVTKQYTFTQEAFQSAVSDDEMHRHIHICMYVRYMIIRVRDKSEFVTTHYAYTQEAFQSAVSDEEMHLDLETCLCSLHLHGLLPQAL